MARDLKITQNTAWFILHKIRETYRPLNEKFTKEVEIDESLIGGKESNKHGNRKTKATQGGSAKTKTPVLGIFERDGKIYAVPVKDTETVTIVPVMRERVELGATIYTDEYRVYKFLANLYEHKFVNHRVSEYVSGVVHTNSIENFWSHLKRGLDGIYHHVSKNI